MKRVYSTSYEVAHLWANQTQSDARCRNTHFDGKTYYSYSEPIGVMLDNGFVVLSTRRWSQTTSKHQSELRSATRHLSQVFAAYPRSVRDSKVYAERKIAELKELVARAKSKKLEYIGDMAHVANTFNEFAKASGSAERIVHTPPSAQELAELLKKHKEQRAKELIDEKERERLHALKAEEWVAEWRVGNPGGYYRTWALPMALRIRGDEIETTRHARIPVSHAVRLWPVILEVMEAGEDRLFEKPLGVYKLNKIRADGSIVVGCHDIPFSELQLIAEQLKLEVPCGQT